MQNEAAENAPVAGADATVPARRKRRRMWILIGIFVALGGVEAIIAVALLLGFAVAKVFRPAPTQIVGEREEPAPRPSIGNEPNEIESPQTREVQ